MAIPSLALIPSAYKAGKVASVKPMDGKGDFTFTRNSEATRINSSGLIETMDVDVPRIDHTDGGCPILLLEPQRTNFLLQSEDFTSEWNVSDATITPNSSESPDGTINASTLTTLASGGTVQESLTVADGSVSFSLFVKKGSTIGVRLRMDAATDVNGYFNLVDGTIHSQTNDAKIEYISNAWYKISISASVTSFNKVSIYTTDGTTGYDNGTLFIYGAQLEVGSYPTSYIPTNGTTVTRGAEVCNGAGDASTFNSAEGVLFAEISALANDGTNRAISISDGSTVNVMRFYYSTTDNRIVGNVKSGGTNVFNYNNVLSDATDFIKLAISYKANNYKMYVNGIEVSTDTSSATPIGLTELAFDNGAGNDDFYGKVKQLQVFKTALTDTELQTLTTL